MGFPYTDILALLTIFLQIYTERHQRQIATFVRIHHCAWFTCSSIQQCVLATPVGHGHQHSSPEQSIEHSVYDHRQHRYGHRLAPSTGDVAWPRRGTSGPNSGRSTNKIRGYIVLLLMTLQCIQTIPTWSGGEGCGSEPCGTTGVDLSSSMISQLMTTKLHGHPPHNGFGHVNRPFGQHRYTNVQKRSFRRACNRARTDGMAWYHGRCLTRSDVPPSQMITDDP